MRNAEKLGGYYEVPMTVVVRTALTVGDVARFGPLQPRPNPHLSELPAHFIKLPDHLEKGKPDPIRLKGTGEEGEDQKIV